MSADQGGVVAKLRAENERLRGQLEMHARIFVLFGRYAALEREFAEIEREVRDDPALGDTPRPGAPGETVWTMLAAARDGLARIGRADLATPPAEKRYRPTSPACVRDKCRRAQTDRCRHGHCAQCCRELHADPPCAHPATAGKAPRPK